MAPKNILEALNQVADDAAQMPPPKVPCPQRSALGQVAQNLESLSSPRVRTATQEGSEQQRSAQETSESGMEVEKGSQKVSSADQQMTASASQNGGGGGGDDDGGGDDEDDNP